MEANPLHLSGTITDLLQRGSPVVYYRPARDPGWCLIRDGFETVVVRTETRGETSAPWVQIAVEGGNEWRPAASFALDLRDPAGVDRALRWLGQKLDQPPTISAPMWERRERGWEMDHFLWPVTVFFVRPIGNFSRAYGPIVPELANIDPDQPDADRLALAAVVRHLAGVRDV